MVEEDFFDHKLKKFVIRMKQVMQVLFPWLQISFQLEVCTQSYGPPKLQESNFGNFTWESRNKMTFGC